MRTLKGIATSAGITTVKAHVSGAASTVFPEISTSQDCRFLKLDELRQMWYNGIDHLS